jgi:serine/threonine protein kinase
MPETDADPLIGSVVGERYRVIAPLGRGGMGAVYRVEHTMMKKELAMKLLHPELSRLDEVARRFEREAEAAARLDHPNIITVTDFGRSAGLLFLIMELCHGPSLTEVIRPDGEHGRPLPATRALHILKQILRALEHAHASGVVHRDLKPDNIVLVERDGDPDFVKLLDFGIARLTTTQTAPAPSEAPRADTLTQAGMVFGTPEYLSPEQAMGEAADGRADLYAAGVILFEMLTGHRPFEAESKLEVVSMHLTRPTPSMRKVAPDATIAPGLERVVAHAMAKKREERFASAGAFLAALEDPAREPPAWTALASSLAERLAPHRVRLGIGVLVAVALLALIAIARRPHPAGSGVLDLTSRQAAELDDALEKLRSARSCKERKAAALKVIASNDKRTLDSLRAARDRRGGFLGLESVNECMLKELNGAIRKLEAK